MLPFALGAYLIVLLLTQRTGAQTAVDNQNIATMDCAAFNAVDICNCTYNNKYDSATIVCGNATVGDVAPLKLVIYEKSDVDIYCSPTGALTVDSLARLPALGAIREYGFLGVHHCLPFTDLLTRLAITRFNILHIYGLGVLPYLSAQHLGCNLTCLQTVGDLELLAQPYDSESAVMQRLDAELFAAFHTLWSLKIDLNFTQLPARIFAPLAETLTDLLLYGRLREFPRVALAPLCRLRTLTLMRHDFGARLRANDFAALSVLEQLTLHKCGITQLPAHIFTPLSALRALNLGGNELSVLPQALFVAQPRLQVLDLSGNQLTCLPRTLFHAATKLTHLDLSRNRLFRLSAHNLPPLSALRSLSLISNDLHAIEAHTFEEAQQLQFLNLDNNRLHWTSAEACAVLSGMRSLTLLTLQNNTLTHLCADLRAQNLHLLDLRYNRLTHLSAQQLRALNNSASLSDLYLSHNPWNCDCDAQLLHSFVKRNRQRFKNLLELRCGNALLPPLVELTYRDFCLPDPGINTSFVLAFACLSTLSLIALLTALCYYKYKLPLQIWLYAHHLCLCCITESELDRERKYDAFISYAHQDEPFVERELLPGLEHGSTTQFKVCIHARDWLAGAFIAEQIIDSVEQSRRTIIVLSQHFIASSWARMEFRMAHQCALNEGRTRIILIIYGDLMDTELLDQELRAYLRMNTYLKWGEPWFWEKLRYAMPHTRRSGERDLGITKKKKKKKQQRADEIPLNE